MSDSAGWDPKPFNEQNPFGKMSTVVRGDNIEFSRARVDAIRAVKSGRATPEQHALVAEADQVISDALSKRSA
ncbi:MAG: hypothetical protein GEU78_07910 [Actinobacteria bacterium]|nr:hypothetical protein [Actinomycetota bacterium]